MEMEDLELALRQAAEVCFCRCSKILKCTTSQIPLSSARQLQEDVSLMDLFRGATKKAMIVATILMIYQQFSGINVVIFFASPVGVLLRVPSSSSIFSTQPCLLASGELTPDNLQIFADAGFSNGNLPGLIVGVVQVVITAIACVIIDKTGRRALLITAGIGMAGASAILGYYFWSKDHDYDQNGAIAVAMVVIYIAFFGLGLGAIPWLMMSEIFPAKTRGMASSAATLLNW